MKVLKVKPAGTGFQVTVTTKEGTEKTLKVSAQQLETLVKSGVDYLERPSDTGLGRQYLSGAHANHTPVPGSLYEFQEASSHTPQGDSPTAVPTASPHGASASTLPTWAAHDVSPGAFRIEGEAEAPQAAQAIRQALALTPPELRSWLKERNVSFVATTLISHVGPDGVSLVTVPHVAGYYDAFNSVAHVAHRPGMNDHELLVTALHEIAHAVETTVNAPEPGNAPFRPDYEDPRQRLSMREDVQGKLKLTGQSGYQPHGSFADKFIVATLHRAGRLEEVIRGGNSVFTGFGGQGETLLSGMKLEAAELTQFFFGPSPQKDAFLITLEQSRLGAPPPSGFIA